MTNMKHSSCTLSRILFVSAGILVGAVTPALAYNPPRASSADLVSMLNSQLAPTTRPAYYTDANSGKRFLLDRTGPHALLKFEGEEEVFALRSSNGPRGDQFYRTDTGRVFLRVTNLGNVIIFPLGDRHGAPTSLDAASNAIIPPPHPANFDAALKDVQSRIASSLGSQPKINISSDLKDYADWTMEAVQTASSGISLAQNYGGVKIEEISFRLGEGSAASLKDDHLRITIVPADGFAGRPSSEAIAKTITKRR